MKKPPKPDDRHRPIELEDLAPTAIGKPCGAGRVIPLHGDGGRRAPEVQEPTPHPAAKSEAKTVRIEPAHGVETPTVSIPMAPLSRHRQEEQLQRIERQLGLNREKSVGRSLGGALQGQTNLRTDAAHGSPPEPRGERNRTSERSGEGRFDPRLLPYVLLSIGGTALACGLALLVWSRFASAAGEVAVVGVPFMAGGAVCLAIVAGMSLWSVLERGASGGAGRGQASRPTERSGRRATDGRSNHV